MKDRKIDISKIKANEYQNIIIDLLQKIFPNNDVKKEWGSATFGRQNNKYKKIYAPRTDVAISPFNTLNNIKYNNDQTHVMKNCLLVKRLNERYDIIWNDLSKCFLAIEVSFSGSSKHIMGDFLNATSIGAVGIVVSRGKMYEKADRILQYLKQLEKNKRLEKRSLRNLMLFDDVGFIQFLEDLYDPDKSAELIVEPFYKINFKYGFIKKQALLDLNVFWDGLKPSDTYNEKALIYDLKVEKLIRRYDLTFSNTKFTSPSTIEFCEYIESGSNQKIGYLDIIDLVVNKKFRNKGIGSAWLKIIKDIARDNNCKYIFGELATDTEYEPLESQKRFFKKNGFHLWYDKRGEFSGWFIKQSV